MSNRQTVVKETPKSITAVRQSLRDNMMFLGGSASVSLSVPSFLLIRKKNFGLQV